MCDHVTKKKIARYSCRFRKPYDSASYNGLLIHDPVPRILLHIRRKPHTLLPFLCRTLVEMRTNVRETASNVVGEGLRFHSRLQEAQLCCEFLTLTFVALAHLCVLRLCHTLRDSHGELVDVHAVFAAVRVHGFASRGPRGPRHLACVCVLTIADPVFSLGVEHGKSPQPSVEVALQTFGPHVDVWNHALAPFSEIPKLLEGRRTCRPETTRDIVRIPRFVNHIPCIAYVDQHSHTLRISKLYACASVRVHTGDRHDLTGGDLRSPASNEQRRI